LAKYEERYSRICEDMLSMSTKRVNETK